MSGVITLSAVFFNVMLSFVMLNVVMLNVVIPNVVDPSHLLTKFDNRSENKNLRQHLQNFYTCNLPFWGCFLVLHSAKASQ